MYPEVGVLHHMAVVFLILGGTSTLFSEWVNQFTFPRTAYKSTLYFVKKIDLKKNKNPNLRPHITTKRSIN